MADKENTSENAVDFAELLEKGRLKEYLIQGLKTLSEGPYTYVNPYLIQGVIEAIHSMDSEWEDDAIESWAVDMFSA